MRISEITFELNQEDRATIGENIVEKVNSMDRALRQKFSEVDCITHGPDNSFSNCSSHPDFTRVFKLHLNESVDLLRINEIRDYMMAQLLALQPAA